MGTLDDIRDHLQKRRDLPLPRREREALIRAIDLHMEHGVDIARALSHGDERRANAALRRCGELLAPMGSDTHRANLIAALIVKAKAPGWAPRTEADRALAYALSLAPLPGSARWIYQRIRDE
ncbi:MAG: hypothetical protein AB7G10_19900 [Reyranellaceae bacterium]